MSCYHYSFYSLYSTFFVPVFHHTRGVCVNEHLRLINTDLHMPVHYFYNSMYGIALLTVPSWQ